MAITNEYRLQLRSHKELFHDRNEALTYLDENFKISGKIGEPVVVFYGDNANKPNMILAVGSTVSGAPHMSYTYIDHQELADMISEVSDIAQNSADAMAVLDKVIAASGLVKTTENRVTPDVDYVPDPNDPVIKDCRTIAEAIQALATLAVSLENSIDEVKEDGPSISRYDLNERPFDDNIIIKTFDGILAAVDLEYDENTNTLTFSRSGVNAEDQISTEAVKKVFNLGKHTVYTANNDGNIVKVSVDNNTQTISANIELGDGMSVVNGKLTSAVPKVVESASYNAETNELAIVFESGDSVNIPVSGLIDEFKANNTNTTVTVTVNTNGEGGKTEFSANVNITDSSDNIIDTENNGIIVKRSLVKAIADESVGNVETSLNNALNSLSENVNSALDGKADKTYVDAGLAEKSDNSALTGLISGVSYNDKTLTFTRKNQEEPTSVNLSDLIDNYVLQPATNDTLGGVVIEDGSGLAVDENGHLSVIPVEMYDLPKASVETLGGMRVGNGLSANENGVVSVKVDQMEGNAVTVTENGVFVSNGDGVYVKKNDVVTNAQDIEGNDNPISAKLTANYIDNVQTAVNNRLDSVSLISDGNGKYTLFVGGVEKGSIDVPSEVVSAQLLDNADYNSEQKILTLTFNVYDEVTGKIKEKVVSVPLNELSDMYTAKQDGGLSLVENAFSLKVDTAEGNVVSVSQNGVFVDAYKKADVDEALSGKQDKMVSSDTVSVTDNDGNPKPNVILSSVAGNIITNDNGLYANVDISIDSGTNTLILSRNGETKSVALPGVRVLDSSSYVKVDGIPYLRLVFADGGYVDIPVSDLVDRISVPSEQDGPVSLSISETQDGKQLLSASLDSSKINIAQDGTNSKVDITPDGDNKRLLLKVDVEGLVSVNVAGSNNALKYNPTTNSLFVKDLESTMSDISAEIARLTETVNALQATVSTFDERISQVANDLQMFKDHMLDFNDLDGNYENDDDVGF